MTISTKGVLNILLGLASTLAILLANTPSAHAGGGIFPLFVDENEFIPTLPCRIIDTRSSTSGSPIEANGVRGFNVSGDVAAQGGNADGCLLPSSLESPVAVQLNVIAVPVGPQARGNLRVFPGVGVEPQASLLNFTLGTNISNAAAVATTSAYILDQERGSAPDIRIRSNFSGAHVVADVLGYYFPKSDDQRALEPIAIGRYDSAGRLVGGTSNMSETTLSGDGYFIAVSNQNLSHDTHSIVVTNLGNAIGSCSESLVNVGTDTSESNGRFVVRFREVGSGTLFACGFHVVIYRLPFDRRLL